MKFNYLGIKMTNHRSNKTNKKVGKVDKCPRKAQWRNRFIRTENKMKRRSNPS